MFNSDCTLRNNRYKSYSSIRIFKKYIKKGHAATAFFYNYDRIFTKRTFSLYINSIRRRAEVYWNYSSKSWLEGEVFRALNLATKKPLILIELNKKGGFPSPAPPFSPFYNKLFMAFALFYSRILNHGKLIRWLLNSITR